MYTAGCTHRSPPTGRQVQVRTGRAARPPRRSRRRSAHSLYAKTSPTTRRFFFRVRFHEGGCSAVAGSNCIYMNACNPCGKRFWFHKSTKWFPQKVHIFVAQNLPLSFLPHSTIFGSSTPGTVRRIGVVSPGMYPGNTTSSLDATNRPGMMAQSRMAETPEISPTQSRATDKPRCLGSRRAGDVQCSSRRALTREP